MIFLEPGRVLVRSEWDVENLMEYSNGETVDVWHPDGVQSHRASRSRTRWARLQHWSLESDDSDREILRPGVEIGLGQDIVVEMALRDGGWLRQVWD